MAVVMGLSAPEPTCAALAEGGMLLVQLLVSTL